MKYSSELNRSMEFLSKNSKTIFLGQAVEYSGTVMTNSMKNIPSSKKIELPVTEEMQMGMSIGLSMSGIIPVSIFPRLNFLILAMNQLINHLDKLKIMSNGKYDCKVIIRSSIGSERPLHPQFQHIGDFTESFKLMSTNIDVIRLNEAQDIFKSYKKALTRKDGKSTLLIEYGDYHNEK